MPDYTYLQVAQPTTAGHWLLSFAYPALRDAERLRARLRVRSTAAPAGAGGVNGSRFPLDRERLAALLGFDGPIEHTRDAMWQTDGFAEAAWHAAIAATGASRFAEDVELYGSDEFGLLRIGDELCRASALMPQKRNPYALVVHPRRRAARCSAARPACSRPSARRRAGPTTCSTPTARSRGAVELATRAARPRRGDGRERCTVDARASRRRAATRSRPTSPSRSACSTGSTTARPTSVGRARSAAHGALDAAALGARRPAPTLDPRAALATRTVPGGAAPAPMDAMLADCRAAVADARARRGDARAAAIERARERASCSGSRSALGSRSSVS